MIQTGGGPSRRRAQPCSFLLLSFFCLFPPHVLTFILILFMFMFKTSTPSSAKTLTSRPCLSPKGPPPGSSDPLIKPSSPAACPEPSSSSVTPRAGGSGAKEMKAKVRTDASAKGQAAAVWCPAWVSFSQPDFLQLRSDLDVPPATVEMGTGLSVILLLRSLRASEQQPLGTCGDPAVKSPP